MIYFDNSATSYPKPFGVYCKSLEAQLRYSFNSGRGGYRESVRTSDKIFSVREKASEFFGAVPHHIVFTKNCTEALNIAIKGSVKKGDRILISSLEHNSVSRVVQTLSDNEIADYDIFDYSPDESETIQNFTQKMKSDTSVVVCTQASNVFGCIMPIRKIGEICRRKGIVFIVDAAQSAGILDIDMTRDNIDILCTAGHKGLMGAMGTGMMIVGDVPLLPLLEGGTGSSSLNLQQPSELPEGFEAGTLNNSGILSLGAGMDYINATGMDAIYQHEMSLVSYLYDELKSMEEVTLYTPKPQKNKDVAIISFNFADYSSEKTAALLSDNGVCTRAGYHCSPLAHQAFGTIDRGTVRISLGAFNKIEQCVKFVDILSRI